MPLSVSNCQSFSVKVPSVGLSTYNLACVIREDSVKDAISLYLSETPLNLTVKYFHSSRPTYSRPV